VSVNIGYNVVIVGYTEALLRIQLRQSFPFWLVTEEGRS